MGVPEIDGRGKGVGFFSFYSLSWILAVYKSRDNEDNLVRSETYLVWGITEGFFCLRVCSQSRKLDTFLGALKAIM